LNTNGLVKLVITAILRHPPAQILFRPGILFAGLRAAAPAGKALFTLAAPDVFFFVVFLVRQLRSACLMAGLPNKKAFQIAVKGV
jgi:hypothetical protein